MLKERLKGKRGLLHKKGMRDTVVQLGQTGEKCESKKRTPGAQAGLPKGRTENQARHQGLVNAESPNRGKSRRDSRRIKGGEAKKESVMQTSPQGKDKP